MELENVFTLLICTSSFLCVDMLEYNSWLVILPVLTDCFLVLWYSFRNEEWYFVCSDPPSHSICLEQDYPCCYNGYPDCCSNHGAYHILVKKTNQFLHHESCKAALCIRKGLGEWNKPALLNYFRKCRNKDGIQYYNLRRL